MSKKNKIRILFGIGLAAFITLLFFDEVPQDRYYHNFVDQKSLLDIPNFWNVISNLPFIFLGIIGLFVVNKRPKGMVRRLKWNYYWFFLGISLTAIGSGFYHLNPNNYTLVWDRVPMTITFMSFFSIIIGEYIRIRSGRSLLYPFLVIGLISVAYWILSEQIEKGDLRPYIFVQFLPMILIPVILILFNSRYKSDSHIWGLIIIYGAAKLAEYLDGYIYELNGILSGHTIKHLLAAVAPLLFIFALLRRKKRV